MTFSAYVQNLGILALQWLPVAFCFYVAVRLAVQHGIKAFIAERARVNSISSFPAPAGHLTKEEVEEALNRR